jgi:choline-sulfatase
MGDPLWADHYATANIERTARSEPVPTTDEWTAHLRLLKKHSHSELLSDEFVLAGARQYYAMVSLIDQRVGDLLSQLEQRGQLDNTWIVYSADHGEMLGDHNLMAKMNFYRSSVRVPLIMRPPGGTTGRVETAPVQAFDVAATLLDAGRASPLDSASTQSLVPLVAGSGTATRSHVASMIRLRPGMPTWHAITDGHWRATVNADTGEASELFDLSGDPDETTNHAGDAASGEALDRLRTALASTTINRP